MPRKGLMSERYSWNLNSRERMLPYIILTVFSLQQPEVSGSHSSAKKSPGNRSKPPKGQKHLTSGGKCYSTIDFKVERENEDLLV